MCRRQHGGRRREYPPLEVLFFVESRLFSSTSALSLHLPPCFQVYSSKKHISKQFNTPELQISVWWYCPYSRKKKQPKTQQAQKRDLLWSQLGQQCGSKSHEVRCWVGGVSQGTVTSDWTTTAKVKGKIFPLHLQMCFQCLVFWCSCLECWPVERFCLVTRAKGSCNCTYFSGAAQVLLAYLSSSSIDPGLLATARLARRASQRYR